MRQTVIASIAVVAGAGALVGAVLTVYPLMLGGLIVIALGALGAAIDCARPRPPVNAGSCADGLEALKLRYLAGDLDTIDFALAVENYGTVRDVSPAACAILDRTWACDRLGVADHPLRHGFWDARGDVEVYTRGIERQQRAARPGAVAGPDAVLRLRDRLNG